MCEYIDQKSGHIFTSQKPGKENASRTLYIRSGLATRDQLSQALKCATCYALKALKNEEMARDILSQYDDIEINVLQSTKESYPSGITYIHMKDIRLARILRGFDPESGNTRENIHTPIAIAPWMNINQDDIFERLADSPVFSDDSASWCDLEDECEEMTIRKHDGYIGGVFIEYTDAQIIEHDRRVHAGNYKRMTTPLVPNNDHDGKLGHLLEIGSVEITSTDSLYSKGFISNIIVGLSIPVDITSANIKNIFNRYSTNSEFPIIIERNKRDDNNFKIIEIIFDQNTNDGQEALAMKKIVSDIPGHIGKNYHFDYYNFQKTSVGRKGFCIHDESSRIPVLDDFGTPLKIDNYFRCRLCGLKFIINNKPIVRSGSPIRDSRPPKLIIPKSPPPIKYHCDQGNYDGNDSNQKSLTSPSQLGKQTFNRNFVKRKKPSTPPRVNNMFSVLAKVDANL